MLDEEVGTRNGSNFGCFTDNCDLNPQPEFLSICMNRYFLGERAVHGAFHQGPHNLAEKQT